MNDNVLFGVVLFGVVLFGVVLFGVPGDESTCWSKDTQRNGNEGIGKHEALKPVLPGDTLLFVAGMLAAGTAAGRQADFAL